MCTSHVLYVRVFTVVFKSVTSRLLRPSQLSVVCAGGGASVAGAPVCEGAEDSLKQKRVCAPPSHLHGADGNLLPR